MPTEIEALNRYVQEKGYIRDAFFNYDEIFRKDDDQQRMLLCFQNDTGAEQPLIPVVDPGPCLTFGMSPRDIMTAQYATAFPAIRFNAVDPGYTATDLNGKVVWQKQAGPYESQHGNGSSPVLYRKAVIVLADNSANNVTDAAKTPTSTTAPGAKQSVASLIRMTSWICTSVVVSRTKSSAENALSPQASY